jgi:molybdopterin-binding protein
MNRRWARYGLLAVSTTLLMGVASAPALAGATAGEKTRSTVPVKTVPIKTVPIKTVSIKTVPIKTVSIKKVVDPGKGGVKKPIDKAAFVPAFERGTVTSITSKGARTILLLNTGKQVVTVILTADTEVAKDRVPVPRDRLTVGATVVVKGAQLGKGTVEAYVIVLG